MVREQGIVPNATIARKSSLLYLLVVLVICLGIIFSVHVRLIVQQRLNLCLIKTLMDLLKIGIIALRLLVLNSIVGLLG
jgi:hypothetical protein